MDGPVPVLINVTDAIDSMRRMAHIYPTIGLDISVATVGAQIEIASGFEGEDTRPRLAIYGPSRESRGTDDYTLAYS